MTTVNVTGVEGVGYVGAYDFLTLEDNNLLLWEDNGRILLPAGSEIVGKLTLTGVQAAGYIGTVSLTYGANIQATGVEGLGLVGNTFTWDDVDTTQNANWVDVIDT